jgi:hypothetical protein
MKYLFLILVALLPQTMIAQPQPAGDHPKPAGDQPKLPLIRAKSKKVSIRDDGFFDKNAWNLSPATRPDVYTADRTRKTKWVTFYTDIDSIRVKLKPGGQCDFVILLNDKDSCYTRIASAIPQQSATADAATDTIPFTLTEYNAIAATAVINDTDTVKLHFDVGSFSFHLTKEALSRRPSLKKVQTLQMGTRVWQNPSVGATGYTSLNMDGRFGWDLFEGRQVEIDYDHHLLIIHPKMPKHLKGYVKGKLLFQRNFVCMRAAFGKDESYFMLDTGSDQAAIVDSAWAAAHDFTTGLKLIKTSTLKDPRGVQYETKTVLAPKLELNNIRLANVPTLVLSGRNPVGFSVNYLGNDVLKRFNIILDFQHDYIYLKPNGLMDAPYRANS